MTDVLLTPGMFPVLFGREKKSSRYMYPYTRNDLSVYLLTRKNSWHPLWEVPVPDWTKHEAFVQRYQRVKKKAPELVSIYNAPTYTMTLGASDNMRFTISVGKCPIYKLNVGNEERAHVGGILFSTSAPRDYRDILLAMVFAAVTEMEHWFIYKPHHRLLELVKTPADVLVKGPIVERLEALAIALFRGKTLPAPSPSWEAKARVLAHSCLRAHEWLFV